MIHQAIGASPFLDSCRLGPFITMPTMRYPFERLPYPPLGAHYNFLQMAPHSFHPMLLCPTPHYPGLNYSVLSDNPDKSAKNSSIADLRLKARQHLATLGLWQLAQVRGQFQPQEESARPAAATTTTTNGGNRWSDSGYWYGCYVCGRMARWK